MSHAFQLPSLSTVYLTDYLHVHHRLPMFPNNLWLNEAKAKGMKPNRKKATERKMEENGWFVLLSRPSNVWEISLNFIWWSWAISGALSCQVFKGKQMIFLHKLHLLLLWCPPHFTIRVNDEKQSSLSLLYQSQIY